MLRFRFSNTKETIELDLMENFVVKAVNTNNAKEKFVVLRDRNGELFVNRTIFVMHPKQVKRLLRNLRYTKYADLLNPNSFYNVFVLNADGVIQEPRGDNDEII